MSAYGTSSCPLLEASEMQANLAYMVVFFAIRFGIAIAICCFHERNRAGKKLIGWPYIIALGLIIISDVLDIIAFLMTICMVGFYEIYTGMTIASSILYALGIWILLFVVVYRLNIMLREHLGSLTKEHKVGSLIITAVLLIITIVQFSLQSYYNTAQLSRWDRTIDIRAILKLVQKVLVAKNVLYLVAVLISGAASLMSIIAMRSNQLPGGDLIGWVTALYISMFIWTLLQLIASASSLNKDLWPWEASMAVTFIAGFFQVLSFILLLCIGKHFAWRKTATTTEQAYEPVSYQTDGQQSYYSEPPEFVHAK